MVSIDDIEIPSCEFTGPAADFWGTQYLGARLRGLSDADARKDADGQVKARVRQGEREKSADDDEEAD